MQTEIERLRRAGTNHRCKAELRVGDEDISLEGAAVCSTPQAAAIVFVNPGDDSLRSQLECLLACIELQTTLAESLAERASGQISSGDVFTLLDRSAGSFDKLMEISKKLCRSLG